MFHWSGLENVFTVHNEPALSGLSVFKINKIQTNNGKLWITFLTYKRQIDILNTGEGRA
jgi:hypothetical protein